MTRFKSNMLLMRKQQMWVYVVGVLFAVDFVFYGYLPSHRQLQALRRAKAQHIQTIEAATSQEAVLPELEKHLEEAKATVQHYQGSIPSDSSIGLFMRQIAQIMADHDLTNQEIIPREDATAGELKCVPVYMNCSGTLDGLFGFFADLQNLGRLVRIEKASLINDSKFTGQVTMQTEAVIFYRPSASNEPGGSSDQSVLKVADSGA